MFKFMSFLIFPVRDFYKIKDKSIFLILTSIFILFSDIAFSFGFARYSRNIFFNSYLEIITKTLFLTILMIMFFSFLFRILFYAFILEYLLFKKFPKRLLLVIHNSTFGISIINTIIVLFEFYLIKNIKIEIFKGFYSFFSLIIKLNYLLSVILMIISIIYVIKKAKKEYL